MRILYYSVFFVYLNSETYYTSEVKSLVQNYPEMEVLVYSINCDKNQVIKYDKNILWIQRKSLKKITVLFLFLKDMIKIFTKFKPDIIHSVYVIESIIMGVFGRVFRVPSIFHSRGSDFNYFPFISVKKNILARLCGKLNKIIITVSKTMKLDGLKLNISPNKMINIYDGIDLTNFNPTGKKYFMKNETFKIIHIGRFSFEKNHELIIEACRRLREDKVNFHLTLIGIGPLQNSISNLVKQYNLKDHIDLEGWVDHKEIPKHLLKSDLFILPSLTEGMPISVLEAMSMSLPVILTNVGGMSELVQKNGGFLIEKNNLEQLYDAIMYYINNPAKLEIAGKINREFIINNFNWNIHSNKLFNVYSNLKNS